MPRKRACDAYLLPLINVIQGQDASAVYRIGPREILLDLPAAIIGEGFSAEMPASIRSQTPHAAERARSFRGGNDIASEIHLIITREFASATKPDVLLGMISNHHGNG